MLSASTEYYYHGEELLDYDDDDEFYLGKYDYN